MSPSLQQRWRRINRRLSVGLIMLILAACADLSEPTPVPKRTPLPGESTLPAAPTRVAADADEQTWLVMLYSDADDETLEEDMFNDFNEAEMVGSTDRVQVVAQMDRYDGAFDGDGDWTTTKRFFIEQDDDLTRIKSSELADLGEVNMADADTLIDFVTWAAQTYPADKYVLIMSDHGAGWPGGWNDPAPDTLGRNDIPLAQNFGDMLFLMELGDALKHIMAETAIGEFELIGFDACLMSQLEVYAAVAPYARYAVASQEVEPSLGWAYAAILGRLTDSPEIGGAELSQAIVDSYIEQDQQIVDDRARAKYVERVYEYSETTTAEEIAAEEMKSITLTGVDLQQIPAVMTALDELVRVLTEVDSKNITAARRYAQSFESVFDEDQPKPYIDLGNFARLLKDKIDDSAVTTATDALIKAIDRAVIDEKHGEEKPGATGIAIHFPNSKLYTNATAGYKSYTQVASTFAEQSLWDDFLAFHYKKKPLPSVAEQNQAAATLTATTRDQATPTATPDDQTAVQSPGFGSITVAPVTLSASTLTKTKPVLIESTVAGDNVAFVYLFIGSLEPNSDAIRVVDMDFLDPEQTKSTDGVFYPDWGGASKIAIEFEWDGNLFALKADRKTELALLYPEDYGASPAAATYTVDGLYTTAKGKKPRRVIMTFQDGELIQVLAYRGAEATGSLRELTPKKGDRVTILENWLGPDPADSSQSVWYTEEGTTLTFGDDNFTWTDAAAPKGEYQIGFIAEDFDGNWYEAHTTLTVK